MARADAGAHGTLPHPRNLTSYPAALSALDSRSRSFVERAVMRTLTPFSARCLETARPIPRLAP